MPSFFGGDGTLRSLNHSDGRCVNLYPTLNNKGDIAAFYTTPGLALYKALPNGAVASGMYTASNGRCFVVAGTSLYELTAGAILTLRGSVTSATVTRFSDNGIDLIIVNGTDGWLFRFATNVLTKISVHQSTFTVGLTSPAILHSVAHGLIAGTILRVSTTIGGTLPTGMTALTDYYVLAPGLTADNFEISLTDGGAAINTSVGQAGVHTFTTIGWGFPNGCKTISYLNGRFVACEPNTQNFYVSEVLDAPRWLALNVQTADSNPDNVIGEIVSHNELIVFCEQTGETFYDSGAIPTPFVRNISGIFEVGCISPYSISKIDNSVIWLGKSQAGQGVIYRLNGYTPTRISTYSIEYAIQSMATLTDAISFSYQQDGHHFYVITFPSGGRTFAFDINTNLWHERASFVDGNFTRWEAQEYAFFDNKHLVCDYSEGNIYSLDLNVYADGTAAHKWLRSWRAPSSMMKRVVHHKLTLDAEVGTGLIDGTNQQVMMRFSNDGGHTWSNEIWVSMGDVGNYSKRMFWYRLGMTTSQPRIYELSGNTNVRTILLGAYLG